MQEGQGPSPCWRHTLLFLKGLWEIRSPGYVSSRLGQALEVEHMTLFLGFLSDVTSPLLPVCPSPCPF